jgi:ABC-type Zn uptake system ZnuABC Zn-binding protein ZnuA
MVQALSQTKEFFMKVTFKPVLSLWLGLVFVLGACGPAATQPATGSSATPKVLAVETFLAEIAQNVAGERLKVESLIPLGLDPHAFEPTPQDVLKVAGSQVLIVNGAGFETWLTKTLENAGGQRRVVEASSGLTSRSLQPGEQPDPDHVGDPHFWLDPTKVAKYVENIRDGLMAADPAGAEVYTRNAAAYLIKLNDLDAWIKTQVAQIPVERRLLVTNHESFGYFADRYGFKLVGAIVPSVSTEASPSAQQLAQLVDQIKASGAPAVFLETGASPQLAEQISAETGVKVVTGLYTHSVTAADGEAPTYLEMMKFNVAAIVEALK